MRIYIASRVVSIALISLGCGLAYYGAAVDPKGFRSPAGIRLIGSPAEAAAWGIGMLVAGALALGMFGRSPARPAAR